MRTDVELMESQAKEIKMSLGSKPAFSADEILFITNECRRLRKFIASVGRKLRVSNFQDSKLLSEIDKES